MLKSIDTKTKKHRTVAYRAKSVGEDGTFAGYASVFGNVDSYGEIVAPGAFAASLKEWEATGDPLPVLWQHKSNEPIGGSNVLKEDATGLYTEGFLLKNDIQQAKEAFALMQARVVRGLSIGYYVRDWNYNEETEIFTLNELDLVEYSVVTFPANELSLIDSVKQLISAGSLPSLKDFEDYLREAGFSKTQASFIAGNGLRKLLDRREADGENSGVKQTIKLLSDFKL